MGPAGEQRTFNASAQGRLSFAEIGSEEAGGQLSGTGETAFGQQLGSGSGGTRRSLTIGAVCKALEADFPDISISKIRYLEEQKLLTPERTPGGYRKYSSDDVARLRTILRLQRDEFLPLRVIRQELADGREQTRPRQLSDVAPERRVLLAPPGEAVHTAAALAQRSGAAPSLINELLEFGLIVGQVRDGQRYFDENDVQIVKDAAQLARYGVGGRNLRVFRTSADREASLLRSILEPALRSRNPERREEALQALDTLASVTTHLKHLLLIGELRKISA